MSKSPRVITEQSLAVITAAVLAFLCFCFFYEASTVNSQSDIQSLASKASVTSPE